MKINGLLGMGLILGLAGIMSGCGGNDNSTPAASGPLTTVLQGPVNGATVVAKKVGNKDFSTTETGEVSATTDGTGKCQFQTTPSYAYTLVVLPNGTDTLGVPGNKNIQLIAKAGSQFVTPLSTLVAIDTTGTVEAKLVALAGMPLGSNIGDVNVSNTTPAALVLSKTIETAVAAISATVTKAAGTATISPAQLAAVQTQILQAVAAEIAKPATTTATLSVPVSLTASMNSAVTVAIPQITAANPNIVVTTANMATIATSVSTNAVGSSTQAILGVSATSTTAAGTTTATVIAESSKINATTAAAIATATTTAVTASSAMMTVTATPTGYTPPVVVKTALAPAIISATSNISAAGVATITIKFNHAINFDGAGSVKIGAIDVPGTEALTAADTITFTATTTPAAGAILTVTVSGNTAKLTATELLTNFSAAMITKTFTITVPIVPTGSTGGSSIVNF